MNNTQTINGWSYSKGDYYRDSNYDDAFMSAQRKDKLVKKILYSTLGLISFGSFIALLTTIK
jgi:hypothetical protein